MAGRLAASAEVSAGDASAHTPPPTKVNGTEFHHATSSKTKLSEETVRETFSHFGTVGRVLLAAKPRHRSRHTHVRK